MAEGFGIKARGVEGCASGETTSALPTTIPSFRESERNIKPAQLQDIVGSLGGEVNMMRKVKLE